MKKEQLLKMKSILFSVALSVSIPHIFLALATSTLTGCHSSSYKEETQNIETVMETKEEKLSKSYHYGISQSENDCNENVLHMYIYNDFNMEDAKDLVKNLEENKYQAKIVGVELRSYYDESKNIKPDEEAIHFALQNLNKIDGVWRLYFYALNGHMGDGTYVDIEAIKDLKIESLCFIACKLKNKESLQELTELKEFSCDDTIFEEDGNLEFLSPLTQLTSLDIQGPFERDDISIVDIEPLKSLTSLEDLELDGHKIQNIDALANLKNLKTLYLIHNNIQDISVLSELKELREVHLRHNDIKDVSPLSELPYIEEIDLEENPVVRVSTLKNLKDVDIYLSYREDFDNEDLKCCYDEFVEKSIKVYFSKDSVYSINPELAEAIELVLKKKR